MSFLNKEIRAICEDELVATEVYGIDVAMKLKSRLADLFAVQTVLELIAGKPSELHGVENNYKVDLTAGHRMVFACGHVRIPRYPNGEINWGNVSRIKILKIEKI